MDSRSVIPPPPLGGVFGLPSAAPLSPPPPSRSGGLPRCSRWSDLGVHDAEIRVHDAPILAFTMVRSSRSRWTETRVAGARGAGGGAVKRRYDEWVRDPSAAIAWLGDVLDRPREQRLLPLELRRLVHKRGMTIFRAARELERRRKRNRRRARRPVCVV